MFKAVTILLNVCLHCSFLSCTITVMLFSRPLRLKQSSGAALHALPQSPSCHSWRHFRFCLGRCKSLITYSAHLTSPCILTLAILFLWKTTKSSPGHTNDSWSAAALKPGIRSLILLCSVWRYIWQAGLYS